MTDAPTAPLPVLTAAGAATELTHLARAFAHAFAVLGDPAAAAGAPPARRVALATASRLLGAHAEGFVALVPESVLLGAAREEGERRPIDLPQDPAALVAVLDGWVAEVAARAGVVADAALRRHVARVRAEMSGISSELAERSLGG